MSGHEILLLPAPMLMNMFIQHLLTLTMSYFMKINSYEFQRYVNVVYGATKTLTTKLYKTICSIASNTSALSTFMSSFLNYKIICSGQNLFLFVSKISREMNSDLPEH